MKATGHFAWESIVYIVYVWESNNMKCAWLTRQCWVGDFILVEWSLNVSYFKNIHTCSSYLLWFRGKIFHRTGIMHCVMQSLHQNTSNNKLNRQCPPLCTEKKIKSIKHWQHLNKADQESIKCKALLSSAMNLAIDPLEELALQSTTIMESVNQSTSIL